MEKWLAVTIVSLLAARPGVAGEPSDWWNPQWRMRTTLSQAAPDRDDAPRPVEAPIDFPLLLERAGVAGTFDPGSLRVIGRDAMGQRREIPSNYREVPGGSESRAQAFLAWIAQPVAGQIGTVDVYFDTKDCGIAPAEYDPGLLPPLNLLTNPGFEQFDDALPDGWMCSPAEIIRAGQFRQTSGERSLQIVVDEHTPDGAGREVTIAQKVDVRRFAGQEMLFECDLLAERAAYGAPISIELEQFRADRSRIPECAVQPRWLTLELAEGQLVELSQRGRFSHEAATINVRIRVRCSVRDADTGSTVGGPESWFTVWLDSVVLRPAERWPWPAPTSAGFVAGALDDAPINRGFAFTGLRRLAFNGASEGTLTTGRDDLDPRSVHWGLRAGTLEFWCCPSWNADDGKEHVFFEGVAYGHRLQSRLHKRGVDGDNQLEFMIADAGRSARTVRGRAALEAGRWHHVAATWDFPQAHLQLFVDGRSIASQGPGPDPWPNSLVPRKEGMAPGMGIGEKDCRSMPMQAFIGGDRECGESGGAEAVLDELRISDVARYSGPFTPPRKESTVDEHTRALFHFENETHGVHDADDRYVRGHLACELAPQEEQVPLERLVDGRVERRMVTVRPYPPPEQFEANRAERRLVVTRPLVEMPDPRSVVYRRRQVEHVVHGADDELTVEVGGDFEPLMESITFRHAGGSAPRTTLLPRWRANDNVVPFSTSTIAATLATGAKDDAEKAFEVFRYALATTNYYDAHYCETLPGRHRPRVSYTLVKALNIYPFDQCGPLNHMLRKLFLTAGILSNDASGTHHQFEQAFYDGDYRLFDLSPRIYWLRRDDRTVASRRDFEEDLYLKLRQQSGVTSALRGRVSRARFGTAERPHCMDFRLRLGESVSVCWHNEGRWFELTGDRRPIPLAKVPPYFGNGTVVFEPMDTDAAQSGGAVTLENVAVDRSGGTPAVVHARDPAKAASLVYRAACPYIFSDATVVGTYRSGRPGSIGLSLSFDEGKTWTEVWRNQELQGRLALSLLDQVAARYAYWLRLELDAGRAAAVTGLRVRSVFVVSPLALPGKLSQGTNRIRFVGGPVTSPVKTTCRWVERHRSPLQVSLNSIRYYMNGDEAQRNLFVVWPHGRLPVRVTLRGRRFQGEVSLRGLPEGWSALPEVGAFDTGNSDEAATVEFSVQAGAGSPGSIHGFEVVTRQQGDERVIPVQVLLADAPLVCEVEEASQRVGGARPLDDAELSGAGGVRFDGQGELQFDLHVPREGTYALWLRGRWQPDSGLGMRLALDGKPPRHFSPMAMIGFTEWTDPRHAHTKMFAHFGEQYVHWSWYRLPDVPLPAGEHQLTLGAEQGACLDALLLLPQDPVIDRASMNLFQNWNYAPWEAPQ